MSKREASRTFGVNRRTVTKMAEHPLPPGYRLVEPRKKPRMQGFEARIDDILRVDETEPRKQRHTATRIFERLRDEFGYLGGYTQVRTYVAAKKIGAREVFLTLAHLPGEAQADFLEAVVEIGGVRVKVHCFLLVLPHSGVWFMRIYPRENSESFVDGNVAAFRFLGGAPRCVVYDNPAYAVKRGTGPMKGRARETVAAFSELRSAFLFEAVFAAPRKGNEKGSVERHVGTLRQSLLVPVPKASSFEELNRVLLAKALAFKENSPTFGEDAVALLPLADYEPCRLVACKADKSSFVRFDGNAYSVPTNFAHRSLVVRATPFQIHVLSAKEEIAVHERSLGKGRMVTDLAHYVDLLARKPRAVRTSLAVLQAGLPDRFELFRRKVEDGTGEGDRRFVGVLKLSVEFGPERVADALGVAMATGVKEAADIRLLVMRQTEALPATLCMDWKLPSGQRSPAVERPPLSEYTGLLRGVTR
ncbi:MAG: IS21 family transposase [Acidobacteria bacterium]|nr:IS21 family transposase [Acidobacteriota bacterium]